MVGKAWRKEHKAPGRITSAVREQKEMSVHAQLTLAFLVSPRPKLVGRCYLLSG